MALLLILHSESKSLGVLCVRCLSHGTQWYLACRMVICSIGICRCACNDNHGSANECEDIAIIESEIKWPQQAVSHSWNVMLNAVSKLRTLFHIPSRKRLLPHFTVNKLKQMATKYAIIIWPVTRLQHERVPFAVLHFNFRWQNGR